MEELYSRLKREFIKSKNSITFNPELLDRLNYEERKNIEGNLLRLCKSGSMDCFKYIPYMKCVFPEKEISFEKINSFPYFYQANISYALFRRTNDINYCKIIIKCANIDIKSFGLLIYIYNEVADYNIKSMLEIYINDIIKTATGQFKSDCEFLVKRNINMNGDDIMESDIEQKTYKESHTRFDDEGIRAYTEQEYLAMLERQKKNPYKHIDDLISSLKEIENSDEFKAKFKK